MKKIFFSLLPFFAWAQIFGQADIYPAKPQAGKTYIMNGTVHVGDGQVMDNTTIVTENGKIIQIGQNIEAADANAKIIDAKGKQVYPGLILSVSTLGLQEIAEAVRGSNDFAELGDLNPSIRSVVAYNTDSKIIGTLRANGILLAGVAPQGGTISGSSSVVQLDAWNWEDAAYKMDNGIHVNMPTFILRPRRFGGRPQQAEADPVKQALEKIEEIKEFFRQARAYLQEPIHAETNLKFEAVRGLFEKKQKLFVHGDQVRS